MVLLIDNYDSFSYNLYQFVGTVTPDIRVIRNDEMTVEGIKRLSPEFIILSPGPGRPEKAGICIDVAKELGDDCKILGVCLGHQAICEAYGAQISYAKELMHGKQSICNIDTDDTLFKGLDNTITVGRYHSLAAKENTIPDCFNITARTLDGEIMAVKHKTKNIWGVQFHPESILTPGGQTIINNFLGGK